MTQIRHTIQPRRIDELGGFYWAQTECHSPLNQSSIVSIRRSIELRVLYNIYERDFSILIRFTSIISLVGHVTRA